MENIQITETGPKKLVLTEEEIKVLSDYQASGGNINIFLRKKAKGKIKSIPIGLIEIFEREVEVMDSLIDRSGQTRHGMVVYRGLPSNGIRTKTYVNPCYIGTTYNPALTLDEVIAQTNREIVQEIHLNSGQRAIYLPAYFPSDPFNERELLLPRNLSFHITNREEKNGITIERVNISN